MGDVATVSREQFDLPFLEVDRMHSDEVRAEQAEGRSRSSGRDPLRAFSCAISSAVSCRCMWIGTSSCSASVNDLLEAPIAHRVGCMRRQAEGQQRLLPELVADCESFAR